MCMFLFQLLFLGMMSVIRDSAPARKLTQQQEAGVTSHTSKNLVAAAVISVMTIVTALFSIIVPVTARAVQRSLQ
jgi:hypothetical protein